MILVDAILGSLHVLRGHAEELLLMLGEELSLGLVEHRGVAVIDHHLHCVRGYYLLAVDRCLLASVPTEYRFLLIRFGPR